VLNKICQLACRWHKLNQRLPKYDRHTLGEKTSSLLINCVTEINRVRFLIGSEKLLALKNIAEQIDALKIILRLIYRLELLEEKTYISLESDLNEIGRMLGGWIKYLKENKGTPVPRSFA